MANKITLIKKVGSNPTDKSKLYYAQVKTTKTRTYQNLNYEGSGLTEETMGHAVGKLVKGIKETLLNGNAFKIEGLGTLKIKVKSESATNAKDLTAKHVKYNGIQFLVNKDLKNDLEDIKFIFDSIDETEEDDTNDVKQDHNLGNDLNNKE